MGGGSGTERGKRAVVTRLWQLVLALNGARFGRTGAQLRQELGVSRSTLYRDLETLEGAGVGLERSKVNGEVRFRLVGLQVLAVAPTPLQLAALSLARDALAPLDGTAVVRELDGLLAKWSRADAAMPGVSLRGGATDRSALLAIIDSAIAARRRLVIEYQGNQDLSPRRREIEPLALRLEHEQPYLFAFCLERKAHRLFKLARVAAAHGTGEPASDHTGVDLEALLAHSVKVWLDAPLVTVVARLTARKARFAAEYPLVPDQELELLDDGSGLLRATVTGTTEALRWALGWGADLEIVAPKELRDAVRRELRAAAARYAGGPIGVGGEEGVSQSWDTAAVETGKR